MRQAFQSAALNIPIIINPLGGGSYTLSYPGLRMGIGWREQGYIEVYINGGLSHNLSCIAVYSKIDRPIVTTKHIVYGINSTLVNDTRLLPKVMEFYEDGSTYILLDTCRLLYQVDKVTTYTGTIYYVRLFYVSITPHIQTDYGYEAHAAKFYLRESPTILNYENVQDLLIRINYGGNVKEITPSDLGASVQIDLTITIYNVGVEVR
ncbi:MAG: hypothetical protein J7L82_07415 [Staphylothermus sp.]|nr:hypothetical protein [Staphylothermus sp.]